MSFIQSFFWKAVSFVTVIMFSLHNSYCATNMSIIEAHHAEVIGDFEESKDMSAGVCLFSKQLYIASDETRGVQSAVLDENTSVIEVGEYLPLGKEDGGEYDIEGMAYSDALNALFLTGSHSLSRKNNEFKPERYQVFRVPVGAEGELSVSDFSQASLLDSLKSFCELNNLSIDEIDIEGMAILGESLFFGFRAPSSAGYTRILQIDVADLFAGKTYRRSHEVGLSVGMGIRDMVAVAGGIVLLCGPSDDADVGYTLRLWMPDRKTELIGFVPTPRKGKAEGLILIRETETLLKFAVLFDGVKNGAPLLLTIAKETADEN